MTEPTTTSVGQYVRDRRKAAGLTQRALGELAGVGPRFVSELERGKPKPALSRSSRWDPPPSGRC